MKGVSEIIAVVLIIAVTIALAVIVSTWSSHWVQKETKTTSPCVLETGYILKEVKFISANNKLFIMLENTGKTSLYGFGVEVMNDSSIKFYNETSPDVIVSPPLSENNPLRERQAAIIYINMNGTEGDYSQLGRSAKSVKVTNAACPYFSASVNEVEKV